MECQNKERNLSFCSCSYPKCSRKGVCCECIRYHLSHRELPACFFSTKEERTYNRSIDYFVSLYKK
ncbi:MAG: DUF6485 family protein [Candidatus Omnitrophica bacterium]|nr:DUF6485 family protein [Candidatus Omnitrophota bacterium]MCM8826590.1 DUF6485 family protein [Candidatus Omnitrophota bacterium]